MLGVISCYWTAERVLELMQEKCNYQTLNFSLFTPINRETPVYIAEGPELENHSNASDNTNYKEHPYYSIFKGLKKIINDYKGQVTEKVKKIIDKIDMVEITKYWEDGQQATIIEAGQTTPKYI